MKLGIIVGHTSYRPGAYSQHLQSAEYPWNLDLAKRIEACAEELEIKTFFRDTQGIAGAYADSDRWGSDVTVELHFNTSDNAHATGTGVIYDPEFA